MKLIDDNLMAELSRQARTSPRKRQHLNFHDSYDAPSQRMLIAIEPGSYVRPHRHLVIPKPEAFLVVRGRLALLTFEAAGAVGAAVVLGPGETAVGAELPAGVWHTVAALDAGTVFYETKPGPYTPIAESDFAPWAPAEGSDEAAGYLAELVRMVVGKVDTKI
jgi:cupin fold WbuC family metalloprotein